jgi:acyl-CoA thioester hydrolase
VDDTGAGRQDPVDRHGAQPFGLGEDGAFRRSGHDASIASRAVPSFPFVHRERVRFRDCDSLGHVNNAVFATYLEEARIGVLGELEPYILARVEIDFRSMLFAGDEMEVRSRCSRIGTKSFELEQEIWVGDRLAAESKSVLVAYDYENDTSIPLTDDQKRRLAA